MWLFSRVLKQRVIQFINFGWLFRRRFFSIQIIARSHIGSSKQGTQENQYLVMSTVLIYQNSLSITWNFNKLANIFERPILQSKPQT